MAARSGNTIRVQCAARFKKGKIKKGEINNTVVSDCLRFLLIILGRNGSGNHYFGPKNAEKRID
jgi:hypothetical protein